MSTYNKIPAFAPLNDTNFSQWSICMEAHLIWKELWGMVVCETDTAGKTEAKVGVIWDDWRQKRTKKKNADDYAEIILRDEDSQLVHMHSHDPETVWDTLAQVHRVRGLAMWLA